MVLFRNLAFYCYYPNRAVCWILKQAIETLSCLYSLYPCGLISIHVLSLKFALEVGIIKLFYSRNCYVILIVAFKCKHIYI